jgi:hypothetical protein
VTASPKLALLGNLGGGVGAALAGDINGTAADAADTADSGNKMPVVAIAAGAGVGGLIAILALLCCVWFFLCVIPRRKKKEEEARKKLNRASFAVKSKKLQMAPARGGVKSALGLPSGSPVPVIGSLAPVRKATTSMALFEAVNPALLASARTGDDKPKEIVKRGPRMTMALSSYKRPVALSPRKSIAWSPQPAEEVEEGEEEQQPQYEGEEQVADEPDYSSYYQQEEYDQPAYNDDDALIGIQDDESEAERPSDEEEADYEDEEEDLSGAAGRKAGGKTATHGGWLSNKTKKAVEQAVAPPVENKKLVIGKGALIAESVTREVVRLKRVSKVKGDAEITNLRQNTASRPSVATPVFAAVVARNRFKVDSTRYGRDSTAASSSSSPRKSVVGSRPSIAVNSNGARGSVAALLSGGYGSRPSIALGVSTPRKSMAFPSSAGGSQVPNPLFAEVEEDEAGDEVERDGGDQTDSSHY